MIRGKGPWPVGNSEAEVRKWFISRISDSIEESEHLPLTNLCLDHISDKTKGQRLVEDYKYPESQLDRLSVIADEIKSGRPIQYVLGVTQFCNLQISIEEGALIPRPETEELVQRVNVELGSRFNGKIADIGTGSGCIALALKESNPLAEVIGFDVSESALSIAKLNGQNLCLGVEFVQLNALNETLSQSFNVIVSNPPYIPKSEEQTLEKRVRDFEPSIALFVEDDPLVFYKRILELCTSGVLLKGGLLALECHRDYAEKISKFIESKYVFEKVELVYDFQGFPRHVIANNFLY